MVVFVIGVVGVIWGAGLVLGVVASHKLRPVFMVIGALLVAMISLVAVYILGLNLNKIVSLGSGAAEFRTTASDVGGAKALAILTMQGAVVAYAVGCIAGLIRKKKRNADA